MPKSKLFNEYIIIFDENTQLRLEEIRNAIVKQYPDVEENIRYNMLAYKHNTACIYVAAYKNHIGIYPFYLNTNLENEIVNYRGKGTKDALHFHHNKDLPTDLILKLVDYKFSSTNQ